MTVSACAAKCEKYGENTVSYGYSAHQRTTHSTLIANQAPSSPPKTLDDLIPPQYRQFHLVFEEAPSRQLPPHRPWDHPINLQPDTPKEFKNSQDLLAAHNIAQHLRYPPSTPVPYQVGDRVWLDGKNLSFSYPSL